MIFEIPDPLIWFVLGIAASALTMLGIRRLTSREIKRTWTNLG